MRLSMPVLVLLACSLAPVGALAQGDAPADNAASQLDTPAADIPDQPPQPAQKPTRVWKSVDQNGHTVFTDQPPAGQPAQPMDVQPANTMPEQPVQPDTSNAPKPAPISYKVSIQSPADQTNFHNPREIKVHARVKPNPAPDMTLRLLDDGKPVPKEDGLSLKSPIYRGTHTLKVQLVNKVEKVVAESDTVTIYVHQHSILFKRPKPANSGGQ